MSSAFQVLLSSCFVFQFNQTITFGWLWLVGWYYLFFLLFYVITWPKREDSRLIFSLINCCLVAEIQFNCVIGSNSEESLLLSILLLSVFSTPSAKGRTEVTLLGFTVVTQFFLCSVCKPQLQSFHFGVLDCLGFKTDLSSKSVIEKGLVSIAHNIKHPDTVAHLCNSVSSFIFQI